MRQPRCTWAGAYHHCTNRGHNGERILEGEEAKLAFMDLLAESAVKHKVEILTWCLMDNHYHVVLRNASGCMSRFFRSLNTQYAFWYRKQYGGRGYVFQDRFHSTLIQDEEYLKLAILYVLRNPVQAGLAKNYRDYPWSGGRYLFAREKPGWYETGKVEALFGTRSRLDELVLFGMNTALPVLRSPAGPVLGDERYASRLGRDGAKGEREKKVKRGERRRGFCLLKDVVRAFENEHGVKCGVMDTGTVEGKRLRGELLVRLKDEAGLTFPEISRLVPFTGLKCRSLPHLYRNARRRRDAGARN